MRTRLTVGAAIAMVALMLIGPSSVAAASTNFHLEIVSDSCVGGYQSSTIKAVAGGGTSATELDVLISTQFLRNGHWRDYQGSIGFGSKHFKADGRRHAITAGRPGQVDPGKTNRIMYRFGAFDGDTELWSASIASSACKG